MSLSNDLRSIPALFGDAVEQLGKLVSNEVQLARAEISEKVAQAGLGVAYVAGAGVLLIPVLVVLLITLVGSMKHELATLFAEINDEHLVGREHDVLLTFMIKSIRTRRIAHAHHNIVLAGRHYEAFIHPRRPVAGYAGWTQAGLIDCTSPNHSRGGWHGRKPHTRACRTQSP